MDAYEEAMRELQVIEWAAGIAPMPQHLIEEGTVRREYRRGVRLIEEPSVGYISEGAQVPTRMSPYEEFDLEHPYYEVHVWGVLVERGSLRR